MILILVQISIKMDLTLSNFHRPKLHLRIGTSRHFEISSVPVMQQGKKKGNTKALPNEEIILIEHVEKHPPILSDIGMSSRITNYYKAPDMNMDANGKLSHSYGKLQIVGDGTSPFLGELFPGEVLTALENPMAVSPLYQHTKPGNDFLLSFNNTTDQLHVREFEAIFTAGQQCPRMAVPVPTKRKAHTLLRKLVQTDTYKALYELPMETKIPAGKVYNKFRDVVTEDLMQKWLKQIFCFTTTPERKGYVEFRSLHPVPPALMTGLLTPEQRCLCLSALAGKQRLINAGITALDSQQDLCPRGFYRKTAKEGWCSNHPVSCSPQEQEILAAPWNTTSAYLTARKGKCHLQINGFADPTGCGQGFSYVQVAKKTPKCDCLQKSQTDLRIVRMDKALQLLSPSPRANCVYQNRWEVTSSLDNYCRQKMIESGTSYARQWREFDSEREAHGKRYDYLWQERFDEQNKILSLSSITVETIDNKSKRQHRIQKAVLISDKIIADASSKLGPPSHMQVVAGTSRKKECPDIQQILQRPNVVLKLNRTSKVPGGTVTVPEVVRNPLVIAAYLKIRETMDDESIRRFAFMPDPPYMRQKPQKEVCKHPQKRKVQLEAPNNRSFPATKTRKMEEAPAPSEGCKRRCRRRCSACGSEDHIRSNARCPRYFITYKDRLPKNRSKLQLCVAGPSNNGAMLGQPPLNLPVAGNIGSIFI